MYTGATMEMPTNPSKNKDTMKKKNKDGKGPEENSIMSYVVSVLVIFVVLSAVYSYISNSMTDKTVEVPISQISTDIKSDLVKSIVVKGDVLDVEYKTGSTTVSKKEEGEALLQTLVNYGVTEEQLNTIKIDIKKENSFSYWVMNLLPIIFPILFILVFIWFISRQMKGAGMQAMTFGQSKARMIDPNDTNQRVTFKDVAGCKEAKEELAEIVDFLKNPKKFLDIGARIPKGILLMGAPGTGKTLLARAVAGEARVAFFSISGSEFVEMFVGVGASRVRDLFLMAKKNSPAIIFVDEIDAVGRVRGVGAGGGNDEREQTLNQILVEMDGFEPNEKVIVMAATNRPDVLDPALLRPGRFDRRVTLDLPDRKDREDILLVHSTKKPFAEDVNLKVIAERTPGFSGADLFSLMNEGAILAARENRTKVSQYDLIRSIEKVMLGPERKSHILSVKEKEITAYHEAGHAVLASILPYADPVHKISIIARGHAAGYVLHLPLEDNKLQSKKEFLDDIAVSLGGYVTEKILFNDLTTGPSNDLQVSTALARDMVTKYGMSEMLGPVALEGQGGKVLFGRGVEEREYSEKVSADIDSEVSRIMREAHEKAEKTITSNRKLLDSIAKRLIETETIERAEFETILLANGVTPKKKLDIEHQK
ncbi:MAG: Lysyl-tRNA synthetase [Parcubacteria group bacterium GW2011_GWC2_40_10]|nr:MAG: Lysyl-tRNA synthetase [Parcubacteria group bacterium GW2011_GWC1_39_12]KKR35279.1 MAG: Lysyl-tRNA synthetase [Parcubacteria group bacterium GW2011_GWC2_40_10]KKR52288.1 MAG: Lysyl-tRNA synthetase [Parcubacteria group bacterium GW2011_GWE1_40_20]KKS36420.1 MAG: Lysyl-tRNA synthetase [Parcubacteria group bacterium GW2011_GWE2_42_14]